MASVLQMPFGEFKCSAEYYYGFTSDLYLYSLQPT